MSKYKVVFKGVQDNSESGQAAFLQKFAQAYGLSIEKAKQVLGRPSGVLYSFDNPDDAENARLYIEQIGAISEILSDEPSQPIVPAYEPQPSYDAASQEESAYANDSPDSQDEDLFPDSQEQDSGYDSNEVDDIPDTMSTDGFAESSGSLGEMPDEESELNRDLNEDEGIPGFDEPGRTATSQPGSSSYDLPEFGDPSSDIPANNAYPASGQALGEDSLEPGGVAGPYSSDSVLHEGISFSDLASGKNAPAAPAYPKPAPSHKPAQSAPAKQQPAASFHPKPLSAKGESIVDKIKNIDKKILAIIGGVVLILVLGAAGAYFFMGRQSAPAPEPSQTKTAKADKTKTPAPSKKKSGASAEKSETAAAPGTEAQTGQTPSDAAKPEESQSSANTPDNKSLKSKDKTPADKKKGKKTPAGQEKQGEETASEQAPPAQENAADITKDKSKDQSMTQKEAVNGKEEAAKEPAAANAQEGSSAEPPKVKKTKQKPEDIKTFLDAAKSGSSETIYQYLKEGMEVDVRGSKGDTALMFAAWMGHDDVIRLLLEYHANVNAQQNDGYTALMYACSEGHLSVVELLLENHADTTIKGNGDVTAIMFAKAKGFKGIEKILERQESINSRNAEKGRKK